MAAVAAGIPVELPPIAQVKLILMKGITNHLRVRFGGQDAAGPAVGTWARASREIDMDEGEISHLRAGRYDRFSLDRLVTLCDEIGVRLTITAG